MAADQVRGTTTRAPTEGPIGEGGNEFRVIGKAQIIVAAKGQPFLTTDDSPRPAGGVDDLLTAAQVLAFSLRQFVIEIVENHGASTACRAALVLVSSKVMEPSAGANRGNDAIAAA
jgi:hypothetical protein